MPASMRRAEVVPSALVALANLDDERMPRLDATLVRGIWRARRASGAQEQQAAPHRYDRLPVSPEPGQDRGPGGRSAMAVKVIVELKAKPGRRDELRSLIEELATRDRPSGYHGSTYYESLDDPDLLIDIADWESPEARSTHLAKAMAAGSYGPVLDLLAGPFRATVIRRLS